MSYCRWSSDNGYCDLYVYEDCYGGYTTHVASRRRPPGAPPCPTSILESMINDIPEDWNVRYVEASALRSAWDKANPPLPIGGPHDGESFNDETPEDLKERLLGLRAVGYRFPDYVLDAINEDIREMASC